MDKILVLLHTEKDDSLAKSGLEVIGAAKALLSQAAGGEFTIGLVGEQVQSAADRIARCGASKILAVAGPEFGPSRYATDAAATEAICQRAQAGVVLAPATSRWNRTLAGVAQRLGGRIDTHITAIDIEGGTPQVHRWYYRQRMEGVVKRTTRPWFILLEPGTRAPWEDTPGQAEVETLNVSTPENLLRTNVVGMREPAGDAQTIRPDADLLFVAGAGWTKKQSDGQSHGTKAEALISEFLKLSRSSLGSTKSLVDLGSEGEPLLSFLTHFNQVGQTGSTPRHPKGLATCCHGEEPHTVGWRFINERRAVNIDPNCGWARGKADVLYVADAFAVMAKVNELLALGK